MTPVETKSDLIEIVSAAMKLQSIATNEGKVMIDIKTMPDATKVWAAEFCGCEPQTVYDWIKAKKIKKNPTTNRIPFAEVLKMKSLLKPKT